MTPMLWLVMLTALTHVSFVGMRFATSLYAIHMHASPAVIGVLGALFAVMGMVSSVGVGRLADRHGARRPMLAGAVIMALGGSLAFIWRDLAALFIVSTLVGASYNTFYICAMQALNRMGTPDAARKAVVQLSVGFGFTSFVGPVAAGFAIDGVGHAATFLGFALLPLAAVAALTLGGLVLPAAAPQKTAGPAQRRNALELFRDVQLRHTYIVLTALSAGWDVFNILMPVYAARLGFSASRIGMLFGVFTTGMFMVRLLLPQVFRLFTPWQVLLLSLAMAGIAYLGVPAATSMATLAPLMLVLGVALGVQLPVSIALLFETAPPERAAEAFGLRVSLVSASQTFLPLIAGALGTAAGLGPVFIVTAGVLLVTGVATRRQWTHVHARRRGASEEAAGPSR